VSISDVGRAGLPSQVSDQPSIGSRLNELEFVWSQRSMWQDFSTKDGTKSANAKNVRQLGRWTGSY
jgi:hypothetical protein